MSGWRLIACKVISFLYDIFCRPAATKSGLNPHITVKEPPAVKNDELDA